MTRYKPIALIPHYNHAETVGKVVQALSEYGLPVLIVDDGSAPEQKRCLRSLETLPNVWVEYRPNNGGKGTAMKAAFNIAFARGFTHAVQVDADGQHNLADVDKMTAISRENPRALICGKPIYGDDAPKSRLYGRKITNFWIAVNTLSMDIEDGMCGFRLYPLDGIMPIISSQKLGDRMDFDIEILVYSHWRKIPMIWLETSVEYKEDGVSHFRAWADNWLITKMHARLFFKMLGRILLL